MIVTTPSILITDDDRGFRETVRGMLEPRGFRTVTASCGEEALKIVSVEPVQLLRLDMHMPRLTGTETVHRIRQLNSRLPCVPLSAALDERLIREGRLADVVAILANPVSCYDITNTVDEVLRRIYGWAKTEDH